MIGKGILEPEDAASAADTEAITASSQGGRQRDGALSPIAAPPDLVAEVGQSTAVFPDGGIRSGRDVIEVVALGAERVFVGRPYVYNVGALGKRGVTLCLDLIRTEPDLTLALCGRRDTHEVDDGLLAPRPGAHADRPERRPHPLEAMRRSTRPAIST